MISPERKFVKNQIKLANKILATMRRDGYGNLSVIKLSQSQQAILTKSVSKKGNFIIGKTKEKDLAKLSTILDKFIQSPWTTDEGRAQIREKAATTLWLNERGLHADLTEQEALAAVDLFSTDIVSIIRDQVVLPSDVIFEAIKRANGKYWLAERALYDLQEKIAGSTKKVKKQELLQYVIDWFDDNDMLR